MLSKESHNANALAYATQLGLATSCMLSTPRYRGFPIAVMAIWTRHAIIQEQIQFFFDGGGEVQGYLTWAQIRPETRHRCVSQPDYILHPTEWNEGEIIWLMDFCLLQKYRPKERLALLRQTFADTPREVCWAARHNPDRTAWMACDLVSGRCYKRHLPPETPQISQD